MPGIRHPVINFELQDPQCEAVTTEFGQTAYETLALYGSYESTRQADMVTTVPRTDRVELVSSDTEIVTALRLSRMVTFIPEDARDDTNYIAISLQLGSVWPNAFAADFDHDEEEPLHDDDFTWTHYAVAITNVETQETIVVDGETGHEFEDADVMQALGGLALLRRNLRNWSYQGVLEGDDDQITAQVEAAPELIGNSYQPFDEDEAHSLNYELHTCLPGCQVHHQNAYLN